MESALAYQKYNSPIGTLHIYCSSTALVQLSFVPIDISIAAPNHMSRKVHLWLQAYFAGNSPNINFELEPQGTAFQKEVWQALIAQANYGKQLSYQDLSRKLNKEKAIRAIAQANAKNPIPVIIPCHRIVGSNGKLTGYSGGLWRKQFLLDLERGQLNFFPESLA